MSGAIVRANPVAEPFLRWAGSKRQQLPKLMSKWLPGRRYVEPFMGSACLYFALSPEMAVLGDMNSDLIETFICIRDRPQEVYDHTVAIPNNKETYYAWRLKSPKALNSVQRAARFLYLNRYCFNGLYRTNLRGQFNVPYAPNKTGSLLPWESFQKCSKMLARATLRCADFEQLICEEVEPNDFIYLDPPFAVGNRRIFRQYGPDTFGLLDLERLAQLLVGIDYVGAKFVLSYADSPEVRTLFSEWSIAHTYVQRNIAGFSRHRRKTRELIISNF